jgi:hypothetical protein
MAEPRDRDHYSAAILAAIVAALELSDDERAVALERLAEDTFADAYDYVVNDDSRTDLTVDDVHEFATSLAAAIDATKAESRPETVADWVATAAYNRATVAAAPPGVMLRWRTQQDERVRDLHEPLEGVTAAIGKPFDVGGHPLHYPGEPIGPPEVWINCRCGLELVPENAEEPELVTAAVDLEESTPITVVMVPTNPTALAATGGEDADELHVTLGYFGNAEDRDDVDKLRVDLGHFVATTATEFVATVGGVARMGDQDPPATALLVEAAELNDLYAAMEQVAESDKRHPHFVPHLTLGYGLDVEQPPATEIELRGPYLWWGGKHLAAAVSEEPWSNYSEGDYSIEQWRKACLIKMPDGDPDAKSSYKLPVRTPSGALSRAGVHAAAAALGGARGGLDAPSEAKAAAKRKLRRLYSELDESPPESLTAAPGTHDGPGWLTHPRETQRLRRYWTRGAGAAKIAWGTPNDLTRCHALLSKYIPPPWTWGTCQNMHKEALGFWNPESSWGHSSRRASADDMPDDPYVRAVHDAFVASQEYDMKLPPRPDDWFEDPQLPGPTPLTITADGRVLGHLATWDTCHVGIQGDCVTAPKSRTAYAYFRTGEVETASGAKVPVGQITMNTGHAGPDLTATATAAHYDNTGSGVADVAAGEDDHGIWVAGAMREGVSEEQLYVLKATGALSGDWRRIGGNLELVAALAVNVPGFPVPRVAMAASAAEEPMSLVAAAVVVPDPNADLADRIADLVVGRVAEAERRRVNAKRLQAVTASINAERVARIEGGLSKITAAFGEKIVDPETPEEDPCQPEPFVGESEEEFNARMERCSAEGAEAAASTV